MHYYDCLTFGLSEEERISSYAMSKVRYDDCFHRDVKVYSIVSKFTKINVAKE
jgi:hypothetical protein